MRIVPPDLGDARVRTDTKVLERPGEKCEEKQTLDSEAASRVRVCDVLWIERWILLGASEAMMIARMPGIHNTAHNS
jgi:hypothetical protein